MEFSLLLMLGLLAWMMGSFFTSYAKTMEDFKILTHFNFNCTLQSKNGHLLHGYPMDPTIMIDTQHKILMDWTPKAGCTKAVVMFLDHMGIVYQRDFLGWPHNMRYKIYSHCGYAIAENFEDPEWFRFKMVRNPYDRVASSYFHTMQHADSRPMLQKVDNMSFADFITFLESNPLAMMDKTKGYHFTHQHKGYEKHAYKHNLPPYYQLVIRAEDAENGVAQLNAALNRRGTHPGLPFNYSAFYIDVRESHGKYNATDFLGRLPWSEIRRLQPTSYKYMYDDDLRHRVTDIFEWDLMLYNYTWPYN